MGDDHKGRVVGLEVTEFNSIYVYIVLLFVGYLV